MQIRNRIVEIKEVKLGDIIDHPRNPKIHSEYQKEVMTGVLDEIGWAGIPLVYKNGDDELIFLDGHMRGDIAPEMIVKVAVTDLDEAEAAYFLTTYDPLARLAETENDNLDTLLKMIETDNSAVQSMLGQLADDAGLFFGDEEPEIEDPGAQVDRAEELREKWEVESGQLWKLGEHRVICGDCTDAAVVARLMGGERAGMTFIDQPYNALKSWNKDEANSETRLDPSRWFANDNMEWEDYWNFIDSLFANALVGHSVYVCCDFRIYSGIKAAIEKSDYKVKHCIVWKKNVWGLGKRYRFQHEFVVYACKDSAPFHGGRDQSDVWELDIIKTTDHKTPKPVELPEKAIGNSSLAGEIVLDGCLGHGTTLIACERLNRKCYGVEIEAKYIGVTIERFYQMTGIEPVLLEED